jgi:hypothetical protein
MSDGKEFDDELERVRRYNNLEEHRDELRRVLAKITLRKITGKVEIDLSEGMPGAMRSRESVRTE